MGCGRDKKESLCVWKEQQQQSVNKSRSRVFQEIIKGHGGVSATRLLNCTTTCSRHRLASKPLFPRDSVSLYHLAGEDYDPVNKL